MNVSTIALQARRAAWCVRVSDYAELTKPKVATLVLATVAVSSFMAAWGPPDPLLLLHTLFGTALIAASASALNQWLECQTDAQMDRTADRPLPAGRLTCRHAALFGAATIVTGTVYLAALVNPFTAVLGLSTWFLYVWIYTPLKLRTPANTAIGAVAGAMPVLMGWSAVGAPLGLEAFTLFMIVFLWQFPHFMAIAWIYRREYAAAGLRMLPVVDPTGRRAGAQAVISALILVPVSLLPAMLRWGGGVYFSWALLLGLAQLICSVLFLVCLDETAARRLLRASLVYLPGLLLLLMLAPLV